MYCALPIIQEELETLRERLRRVRNAEQKQRLHLLVRLKEGRVSNRREAAEYLAVHRNSIGRWLTCYKNHGLEAMLHLGEKGAPAEQRTLDPAAYTALQAKLQTPEGFTSYGDVQQWLANEWGVSLAYHAVHRLVHRRLKAKLKRPRPSHPKKTLSLTPPSRNALPALSMR